MNYHFNQASFQSCVILIKCRFNQMSFRSSVVSVVVVVVLVVGIHSRSDTNRTGAEGLSFYYPRLLVDVDYFITINVHTQPLDLGGDWSKSVHLSRSWTNVTRPCFLLKEDPASW